jgi:hypothetical protein
MTANSFAALCASLLIEPGIALENETVCEALRRRASESEMKAILETEF